MGEVLVIGGTGTTGSRVAALLRAAGTPVRIATRKPDGRAGHVRFDWSDPATYGPAVDGAGAVYLVAPGGVTDPVAVVEPLLARALRAGVRRVVLLSASAVSEAATGLGALPRLVKASVPEWAVLRPSWFMQNLVGEHAVAHGIRTAGEIVTATGDGRVAFVDAGDIAGVAVRALLDVPAHDTDHLITGPEALSYADAAEIITAETGVPVRHRTVCPAEFAARFVATGIPVDFAALLARLDEDIRRGTEDRVTSTVHDVTGRPARSFRDFVTAHRGRFSGPPRAEQHLTVRLVG